MLTKFFTGVSKVIIALCFSTILIWSLLSCVFIELNSKLITNILEGGSNTGKLIFWYILLVGIWGVVEYILDISCDALVANTTSATLNNGFKGIYKTKPEVLKKVNAGYVTGLMRTLESKRSDLMLYVFTDFSLSIIYIGYFTVRLSKFHWVFSVILVVIVLVATTVRTVGRRMVYPITAKLIESDSVVTKTFIDVSTNINTVQKMQAYEFMGGKISSSLKEYSKWRVRNTAANDIFFIVFKFIVYMFAPVCLMVTSTHDFGFSNIEFYSLVSPLSVQLVHMSKCISSFFKRLDLYASAQHKVDNIVNEKTLDSSSLVHEFDVIELEDISYAYRHNITKNMVNIKIPSMQVHNGDKICIYGESGQGKTTTLNVLSGQLETGDVVIDGKKTGDKISCVFISQDTEIFDMSVRDNLILGNTDITDEELLAMLDSVGLSDWIAAQEYGLDTLLGERGVFVSTGQRQRLNLIRGLLIQDKDLYLLDEPTSNVDEITERKMVKLIQEKLRDKTFIVVSHRRAIADICNQFYKFEDGVCGSRETSFNA